MTNYKISALTRQKYIWVWSKFGAQIRVFRRERQSLG